MAQEYIDLLSLIAGIAAGVTFFRLLRANKRKRLKGPRITRQSFLDLYVRRRAHDRTLKPR